jgi:hypothetical protein
MEEQRGHDSSIKKREIGSSGSKEHDVPLRGYQMLATIDDQYGAGDGLGACEITHSISDVIRGAAFAQRCLLMGF